MTRVQNKKTGVIYEMTDKKAKALKEDAYLSPRFRFFDKIGETAPAPKGVSKTGADSTKKAK